MEYNKLSTSYVKSNGRILTSSGPRASQDRFKSTQEMQVLNNILSKQIEDLKKELLLIKNASSEDIDTLITTEIDKAIKEISKKYEDSINKLKIELAEKNVLIASKDELINILKTGFTNNKESNSYNENRPSIDKPLVDPIVNGQNLESHISNKDSLVIDNMSSQVDKLKNILGRGKQ